MIFGDFRRLERYSRPRSSTIGLNLLAKGWSPMARHEADLPLFAERSRINDPDRALSLVAGEAKTCTRCPLYRDATQTVFGEGPADASLMLVGEQPGDQEDLTGRPFVGPAGKVLDQALVRAGIARGEIYITNAVKHFKHEPRGKRRIHKKPDTSEIDICRFWLDQEIEIVRPRIVVAMGATAVRGVLRRSLPINANRGRLVDMQGHRQAVITVHPSYLLRLREERDKRREFDSLVQDLRFAADAAREDR
jgi:DNA polymerase